MLSLKYLIMIMQCLILGCNFFKPFDPPVNDQQLLAAARAHFDRGEFETAIQYYQKNSNHQSDAIIAEQIFLLLTQNGLDAGTFIYAMVNQKPNQEADFTSYFITQLASYLTEIANEKTRTSIFQAYLKSKVIQNELIRGTLQFVTSISLLSELLAETASVPKVLKKSDLVVNPTLCLSLDLITQATAKLAACSQPPGSILSLGSAIGSLNTATEIQFSGAPTLFMIHTTIQSLVDSILIIMQDSAISKSVQTFSSSLLSNEAYLTEATSPLYRSLLISAGIGEDL